MGARYLDNVCRVFFKACKFIRCLPDLVSCRRRCVGPSNVWVLQYPETQRISKLKPGLYGTNKNSHVDKIQWGSDYLTSLVFE